MKVFSPTIQAQLLARRIRRRAAIKFVLPSGSYGFILGFRGEVTIEGVKYVGSGGLIEIKPPSETLEAGADDITVSLASHRKVDGVVKKLFDPHLLDSIDDEFWYRQPAVIYRVWFDANRNVEDLEQVYLREIFSVVHLKGRSGGSRVEGRLCTPESFSRLAEAKVDGPELQRLIDPDDRGYDNVVTAAFEKIYWGRKDPSKISGTVSSYK